MKLAFIIACILSFLASGGLLTTLGILLSRRDGPAVRACIALGGGLTLNFLCFIISTIMVIYFGAVPTGVALTVDAVSNLSILFSCSMLAILILDITRVEDQSRRIVVLAQGLLQAVLFILWLAFRLSRSGVARELSVAMLFSSFIISVGYLFGVALARKRCIDSPAAALLLRKYQIATFIVGPFAFVSNLVNFERQPLSFLVFPVGCVLFTGIGISHIYNELFARTSPPQASVPDFSKAVARYGITERERDIIIELLDGLSNRRIAERLFISETTVKSHMYRIF